MGEHKILIFVFSAVFYCLLNLHIIRKNAILEKSINYNTNTDSKPEVKPNNSYTNLTKPKLIPAYMKDACSVLEVFTKKPQSNKIKIYKRKDMDLEHNCITSIGITVFLIILLLSALFDVLKVKEEERARRRLNPNGERRQSLAEFANKKSFRRESSKFGLQLFQIAETEVPPSEEKKSPRDSRPSARPDAETSAPKSLEEITKDMDFNKSESVTNLMGARPAPMLRRSSFPALHLNPNIHNLAMSGRQYSCNSEDTSENMRRPARIIRRF